MKKLILSLLMAFGLITMNVPVQAQIPQPALTEKEILAACQQACEQAVAKYGCKKTNFFDVIKTVVITSGVVVIVLISGKAILMDRHPYLSRWE